MVRPMKEAEQLNRRIIFRCGETLYKKLNDAATASGLTQCDMIRRKLSGIRIQDKTSIALCSELRCLRQAYISQMRFIQELQQRMDSQRLETILEKQTALLEKTSSVILRAEEELLEKTKSGSRPKERRYL